MIREEGVRQSRPFKVTIDFAYSGVSKTQRPKTQDPRPNTQDPRPKTQDPRPHTSDIRLKTTDLRPNDLQA